MTEKQAEKLQLKIKKIKAALAADKRRWGGFYDDSSGRRYLPPQYYIKLEDWTGGLRYINWFYKNFPDDSGFPDFLFELAIILFKANKIERAEKMIFMAFCSNTYILDKFFGRPVIPMEKYQSSNIDVPEYLDDFSYSSNQKQFAHFSEWLAELASDKKFTEASGKFIEIQKLLLKEDDRELRSILLEKMRQLKREY